MFTIHSDGSIQTDSIDDAIALAARMRAPKPDDFFGIDRSVTSRLILAVPTTPVAKRTAAKKAVPVAEPGARRRRGTGSVSQNGKSGTRWRWKLGGVQHEGYATREAATAALDAHLRGEVIEARVAPTDYPLMEWGDPEDGIEKHLVCNGTGKISDPKKLRGKTRCRDCDGEGYRRPVPT